MERLCVTFTPQFIPCCYPVIIFTFFFFLNTFSKYAFNLGLVKWLNIVAGMLPGCMLQKCDIWYPNCDNMENTEKRMIRKD